MGEIESSESTSEAVGTRGFPVGQCWNSGSRLHRCHWPSEIEIWGAVLTLRSWDTRFLNLEGRVGWSAPGIGSGCHSEQRISFKNDLWEDLKFWSEKSWVFFLIKKTSTCPMISKPFKSISKKFVTVYLHIEQKKIPEHLALSWMNIFPSKLFWRSNGLTEMDLEPKDTF